MQPVITVVNLGIFVSFFTRFKEERNWKKVNYNKIMSKKSGYLNLYTQSELIHVVQHERHFISHTYIDKLLNIIALYTN